MPSQFGEHGISGMFKFATISPKKLLKISQISVTLFMISLFSTSVILPLTRALSEKEGFITFQNNLLSVTVLVSRHGLLYIRPYMSHFGGQF